MGPAEETTSVLGAAAAALHGQPDLGRALGWAVEAVGRLTDSPNVALCLRSRDTSPTWTVHPESTVAFDRIGDPRAHHGLSDAFGGSGPMVVQAMNGPKAGPSVLSMLGLPWIAVLPIEDGDQQVRGIMALTADEPLATATTDALMSLCAHLGVAVQNHVALTRLAEEQARGEEVVHRLQEAVRPPAPVVPHTELGVRYVAADPSAPTGGDLYDWITLPDGTLHFTVVDVMGKGVEATKDAVAVTHALRLLVLEGCPLEELVERVDRLFRAQNPELVATLIVGRYWPEDGRVLLAGAGHPPALLLAEGRVREINVPGIPLGWPGAASDGVVELHLDRQDTLILYTDGLIEAKKDIVQGLARLSSAALATADYPANAMARALVDRQLEDALRTDDSLALIVRRRLPPPANGQRTLAPLVHKFSPTAAAVPVARHFLADWLGHLPIDADAIDGLLLVASELAANAVRHADAGPGGIRLKA
ncbi:MAG: ATP-binding SpoIIE family protein phosphatase, partial [Acidimicrobiales bacterium]